MGAVLAFPARAVLPCVVARRYAHSVLRVSTMPLPPRYLATKLSEPLPTTDGGVLGTIGDAVGYMTALS